MIKLLDKLAGWWIDWRTDQDAKSNPEIQEFNLTPGGFEIMAIAPGVAILADQAAELLQANNAENFIEFDMKPRLDRGLRPVKVTIQWAHPKHSPARIISELRQRITELEEQISELTNNTRLEV